MAEPLFTWISHVCRTERGTHSPRESSIAAMSGLSSARPIPPCDPARYDTGVAVAVATHPAAELAMEMELEMMATDSMSPSELAAWAREQHESLGALTKVIKQHIAAMPETVAAEWLHGLRVAFDRLRVHLERDFDTQESGGYMKNLLELRPWMSNEIDRLQSEHSQILRMADRIKTDLSQTQANDRLLIGDICARTSRFMSVVSQHEQRENTFTLLVFNEELGGEG